MKTKKINKISTIEESSSGPTVLNIDSAIASDIFGINSENIKLFEKYFPLEIFQKGNQIQINGDKKNRNLLVKIILQTVDQLKNKNMNSNLNLMQENLKILFDADSKNIKNFTIARTTKVNINGYNPNQNKYLEILNKNKIIFAVGPAGTGKTFLAIAAAVSQLLNGQFDRIILSRPAVEAGEKLGFLPGDLKEKVDPYLRPLYDSLNDLLPSDIILKKIQSSEIEVAPLAFMRGRTLNNSFVILDEAQNATHDQIKMFLTRCGKNSRMVVNGDPSQTDLTKKNDSGLLKSISILKHIKEIEVVSFNRQDIVRDEMVTKIIEAYENHENYDKSNSHVKDLLNTSE